LGDSFTAWPPCLGNDAGTRRLGGFQRRSEPVGEDEKILPFPDLNPGSSSQ